MAFSLVAFNLMQRHATSDDLQDAPKPATAIVLPVDVEKAD